MDIDAFIQSGMIENYCLGFCSPKEIMEIEDLSAKYPAIKNEIEKICNYFEEQLHSIAIQPSPNVKIAVMRSVYKQQASVSHEYAPLIDKHISVQELKKWVTLNNIKVPEGNIEGLVVIELPSTQQVINFIVAAKNGHEQEVHEDFIEYLFVIEGSCIMNFDGKEISYAAGDIISIPPHIKHSAVVTSLQPMLALVQRQFCA